MIKLKHDGDCPYYADRQPGDPVYYGICTCGYGWQVYRDSGGVDESQLVRRCKTFSGCVLPPHWSDMRLVEGSRSCPSIRY